MKQLLYCTGAFAVLGLGVLLADTKVDFDHAANFSQFKTYSWLRVDAGD